MLGGHSEISYQYMAGLLDGDGTITVAAQIKTATKAGLQLHPVIKIDSVNLDFLKLFQQQFGGFIGKKRQDQYHKRPLWEWRISSIEGCFKFVVSVEPFLILKKKQGQLLESFLKIRTQRIGRPYTREEFNLWLDMREANLRARGFIEYHNREEKGTLPL